MSREDFTLGLALAKKKAVMSLREFVKEVTHHLDFNRFDYEGGEDEILAAVLTTYHGYTAHGSVVSFTQALQSDEEEELAP